MTNQKKAFTDPFTLLTADHHRVNTIFTQLKQTSNRATKKRETIFSTLQRELDIHARLEEQVLYPLAKQIKESEEMGFESMEEHHVVKMLLSELETSAKDSKEWKAKLTVLQENIEHHVKEEEQILFKQIKRSLKKDELARLAEEMRAARKKLEAAL